MQSAAVVVRLELEARIKRGGDGMRVVVPPNTSGKVQPHPAPSFTEGCGPRPPVVRVGRLRESLGREINRGEARLR
jgi:hypothetical protein